MFLVQCIEEVALFAPQLLHVAPAVAHLLGKLLLQLAAFALQGFANDALGIWCMLVRWLQREDLVGERGDLLVQGDGVFGAHEPARIDFTPHAGELIAQARKPLGMEHAE